MDTDFVKIITGVRRCGKSSLLAMFRDYLVTKGHITEENILYVNFEKSEYFPLQQGDALQKYVQERITDDGKRRYVLIDEVQEISEWAKIINSIRVSFNVDLYVTGSNSRLFAGEHLTYLTGRYIEIRMYPLSFSEFIQFRAESSLQTAGMDKEKQLAEYIRIGSFPAMALTENEDLKTAIISGLFDSIFSRDILLRGKIKNIGSFYKVAKFVFENIGSPISAHSIANTLKTECHRISVDAVDAYLQLMCNAYILYQCERYDIRGKERLKTNGKYYVIDTALRSQLLGSRPSDVGHIIENLVYLELKRRGYEVCTGKNNSKKIDFIAVRQSETSYYQVCLSVADGSVLKRELDPLLSIRDNYPKYLITTDHLDFSQQGIRHINLLEFMNN
ncbi:MAG: ATP-binding protein [Spirochaetia bacterium]|nr:ATP-binding protein [Spirochaetia bacterium]